MVENIVIIGSGPAGYTAAIYAARANLKPLMFLGFQSGGIPGGQLMTTTEVENFPGFPEGIHGPQLMANMGAQAVRWGAEVVTEDVISVDFQQQPFVIRSDHRVVYAHAVIIATGATAKRMGLPGEETYWNRGMSACAICDGAAPIFRGAELAIVGGGDTAAEEAIFLTKYARHIHLLVRRGELRASKAMQERVLKNPKITVHWHTVPIAVTGDGNLLNGIQIQNTLTHQHSAMAVQGLFYAIGHTPNTSLFQGQLHLDEMGYIRTQSHSVATNVPGVFAAGDVQDHEYRQAITAAGTGCMAALLAERWLSEHGLIHEFHTDNSGTPIPEILPENKEPPTVHGSSGLNSEPVVDLTATRHHGGYALRKLYHDSDRLIMVKYSSPTCGPCHTLKPILNRVVDEFEKQIHYVEIDIEVDGEIAEAAGIVGTPTIQFFKHKDRVAELKGVKQKSHYRDIIQQYL